jgi:hypothetical protein
MGLFCKFDSTILPSRFGNEDVAARSVKLDHINDHSPIRLKGTAFNAGNAEWNTTRMTYTDVSNASCGLMVVTDCVVESRSDSDYATSQQRGLGTGTREGGYSKLHVPVDSPSTLFAPVFELAGYRGPSRVERHWEEYGETVTAVYCNIYPKYPAVWRVVKDGKRKEVGLKDMVDMAAFEGYDLVITVIMKFNVSRCF